MPVSGQEKRLGVFLKYFKTQITYDLYEKTLRGKPLFLYLSPFLTYPAVAIADAFGRHLAVFRFGVTTCYLRLLRVHLKMSRSR